MQDQIRPKIRAYLSAVFTKKTSDSDDIFALGYVNSLFAMELVLFVEKTFGISVTDEDLDLKNFSSVEAMHRFLISKIGDGQESKNQDK